MIFSSFFLSVLAIEKIPAPIKLYSQDVLQSNGITAPEGFDGFCVDNVTDPELIVFTPSERKNTGTAILICPGGGYAIEAVVHEGYQVAE